MHANGEDPTPTRHMASRIRVSQDFQSGATTRRSPTEESFAGNLTALSGFL
jgi:hypothetical protein